MSIKSTKKDLRKFGVISAVILLIWAGIFFRQNKGFYFWFFIASFLALLLAIIVPAVFKPVFLVLNFLVKAISALVAYFILGIIFYLVITPIGLIVRLFGRDFLDRKFSRKASTYWIERRDIKYDKSRLEAQF
ncbi:MAG: hypothetical protein JW734_05055 [Candidatus Omnitrophica bacterium]|nr:hypothetical protein [Candidatus Omnitrophota bacterium]